MAKTKRVLLVNPSYASAYARAKIHFYKGLDSGGSVPHMPHLGLATIASPLLEEGHEVTIFDMNLPENSGEALEKEFKDFSPDFVGITFPTCLYDEVVKIGRRAKRFDENIKVIAGGPHPSSFPESALKNSPLDVAVVGEGDFTVCEVVSSRDFSKIKGICYKKGRRIVCNPRRDFIKDLDVLPYPAWQLYDLQRYAPPKSIAKKIPAGWLETSRGCVFGCIYCNKSVFGRTFRYKSPKKVLDEIEYMLECGFKEIEIADDGFSTDMNRAKEICNLIIERGLDFPWTTLTGIRVDKVDEELLEKMHAAGCYRNYYGIESGNQRVLDGIGKGITLEQVKKAVELTKKAGIEAFGYFMLALPDDTEETMRETIEFAKELELDMAKVAITIPLPGTPMYNELKKRKLLKKNYWAQFNLYAPPESIYDHPRLDWETVEKYFNSFYKEFYFRPKFILKRLVKSIEEGEVLSDFKIFLKSGLFKPVQQRD